MPLFDLGNRKPTTRDIALTVKAGGAEALTDAERRADEARYQEVTCRSALNRGEGHAVSTGRSTRTAAARTAATTASRAATTRSSR